MVPKEGWSCIWYAYYPITVLVVSIYSTLLIHIFVLFDPHLDLIHTDPFPHENVRQTQSTYRVPWKYLPITYG